MKIALISCVKTKKNYSCPGKEMFISSELFRLSYEYASRVADKIYILSTKYGLLDENTIIDPYERTLYGKPDALKRNFADSVISQMKKVFNLEHDEFIIMASSDYYQFLLPELKRYQLPFGNNQYLGWIDDFKIVLPSRWQRDVFGFKARK